MKVKTNYAYLEKKLLFNKNIKPRGGSVKDKKVFKKMLAKVKMNEKKVGNLNMTKVMKVRQHKMYKLNQLAKKRMKRFKEEEIDRVEVDQKITLSNKGKFYDFMNYWTEIQKEKLFDMRKASKAKIIERIQNLKKRQDEKNKNLNNYIVSQVLEDCQMRMFGTKALNMLKAQKMIFDKNGSEKMLKSSMKILEFLNQKEKEVDTLVEKPNIKEDKKIKLNKNSDEKIEEGEEEIQQHSIFTREVVQEIMKKIIEKNKRRRKLELRDFTVKDIIIEKIPILYSRLSSASKTRVGSATTEQLKESGFFDRKKMLKYYKFLKKQNRKSKKLRKKLIRKTEEKIMNQSSHHDISDRFSGISSSMKKLKRYNSAKSVTFPKELDSSFSIRKQATVVPKISSAFKSPNWKPLPILKNSSAKLASQATSNSHGNIIVNTSHDVQVTLPSPFLMRDRQSGKRGRRLGIAKRSLLNIKEIKNQEMKDKNEKLMNTKFMRFFNSLSKIDVK